MEIVLLRHGKPDFDLKRVVRTSDIGQLIQDYDQAGVTEPPPAEAVAIATACDAVVCSALPRSIQTAQALGFNAIHLSEPLFNEAVLSHFKRGNLPMPINTWVALLRSLSLFGFSRNGESYKQCQRRAQHATDLLINIASQYSRILLSGHGIFNHLIAKRLRQQNWQGPKSPERNYWAYGVYRKD